MTPTASGPAAEAAKAANPGTAPANTAPGAPPISEGSRFLRRLHRRYESELALLPTGVPDHERMARTLHVLRERGHTLDAALRITRQLVMERLLTLDCDHGSPLADIVRAVTSLAEFALETATLAAQAELDEVHGRPQGPQGEPVAFWVVGMGKLGARELNVSSDIDLVYVYDQDGQTAGQASGFGKISNHEYFAKAVKRIFALIGETTEHGNVFRMDLALRPHGNAGPTAVSLASLEDYFQVEGREWERFAWLKSRVVATRASLAAAEQLRAVVLPFVFRRYLDYGVFEALRVLHRQIRDHAAKRSSGHPERANDVKLSRGGIREVEFIVQLLQVVRGGQFPELRTRPTLDALQRLTRAGLMPAATAQALADAYEFLRRVEHRIQYLDDQQTHVLPTDAADQDWIAHSLGLPDREAMLAALARHRDVVANEFDRLLGQPEPAASSASAGASAPTNGAPRPGPVQRPASAMLGLDELCERLDGAFRERIASWQSHSRVLALRDDARQRLLRLVARTAEWMDNGIVTEEAALRFADWLESLLRRESYLALLLERPLVHERLLRVLGASRWPARYLLKHPGVIDELAGEAVLHERFDPAAYESDLWNRRKALIRTGEDGEEASLDLLRRAHHAELFRTLVRDVEKCLTVEQVADDLSALADATLRVTSAWCWERLKLRHVEQPQFAIIGYGKLGGKELGYGSDLDIVFVYDDLDERASEIYAAFVRKLITWLTVKTGEGDLFEIDTALRPNGNAGLLVSTFDAFASYQQQRGSNAAWTWEHQAMTRARFVLGLAPLQARFDQVREGVITAERDLNALRQEIVDMRQRVRSAHAVPAGRFDVKHSEGGMVDAEFVVQYLVLAHSARCPELRANAGNIALLERAERAGLLPAGLGTASADAYRELRLWQHRARLNEQEPQFDLDEVGELRAPLLRLWEHVLGAA